MKLEDWLALPDGEFISRWRDAPDEETYSLPAADRAQLIRRYQDLTPWVAETTARLMAEAERQFKKEQRELAAQREREKQQQVENEPQGDEDEPPNWSLHRRLCAKFWQIYPSDEAWDSEIEQLVKIQHLRLRFGSKPVRLWLTSPKKRLILRDNVVFEPGADVGPDKLNLFRGIASKPAEGSCTRLLELGHYLCGEDDRLFDHVLKWSAFPIQHIGAKMHSALVFHGDPGAGKNLFFGAIADIYGAKHAGVITNMQLESQFNDWLSAKLFLIANEVVARREIRHQVGMLLNMVTEPRIWINPKQISGRWEANHANFVFFSNEDEPLHIDPRDRRYMVIRTPGPKSQAFYSEVVAEIKNGGIAALHKYLLELELGDFGVETKPLDTQAKRDVVEMGMPAAQLYWRDIKDGEIGLPYCPALVTDVYRGYLVWCRRNGEKMPERINRFIPKFMKMNGVRRADAVVPDPNNPPALAADPRLMSKRRILLMGEPAPDEDAERARQRQSVIKFRRALESFIRDDELQAPGPGFAQQQDPTTWRR